MSEVRQKTMANKIRMLFGFASELALKISLIEPPQPIVGVLDHPQPLMLIECESHEIPPTLSPETGLGTLRLRRTKSWIKPRSAHALGMHFLKLPGEPFFR